MTLLFLLLALGPMAGWAARAFNPPGYRGTPPWRTPAGHPAARQWAVEDEVGSGGRS